MVPCCWAVIVLGVFYGCGVVCVLLFVKENGFSPVFLDPYGCPDSNKIDRVCKLFHVVDLCKKKFSRQLYGPYHSIFWFQTKSIQLPTQFQMTFFKYFWVLQLITMVYKLVVQFIQLIFGYLTFLLLYYMLTNLVHFSLLPVGHERSPPAMQIWEANQL
jgi:hypothetical protein